MWCSLNVSPTKRYENGYKVIVHKIQAQLPQWIAQWMNLGLLLYININWAHLWQVAKTTHHPAGMGGSRVGSLARATPPGLVWTNINHTYSQVTQPLNSQVKCTCLSQCLPRATGQTPRSNVFLVQLGRFSGRMSVLCSWAERPRDGMIMDNTYSVARNFGGQKLGRLVKNWSWRMNSPADEHAHIS